IGVVVGFVNLFASWRTKVIDSVLQIRNRSAGIKFDCLKRKVSVLVQFLIRIDDPFVFVLIFDPFPIQLFIAGAAVREILVVGTSQQGRVQLTVRKLVALSYVICMWMG